jgi:hypothetical protein
VSTNRIAKRNGGPVIQDEMQTVSKMIGLYCRKKHGSDEFCEECRDLRSYCMVRLSNCPFGEEKSACSNCRVHCYRQDYRARIKTVMRYAGPWMLLYHPVYTVKHMLKR